MKIEISEQPSNEPVFPAFYKDGEGDLWYWLDAGNAICFGGPFLLQDNDWNDVDFYDYNDEHKFVRVQGTITITV